MTTQIMAFITLAAYAVLVGQSFFYILGMSVASKRMQLATYIETRKLLDEQLRGSLRIVYYLTLATTATLVIICLLNANTILLITSLVSLAALVADIMITLNGNVPLNNLINTWTLTEYPADWQQYRSRWFGLYHTRQAVNITGFASLLAGVVFGL